MERTGPLNDRQLETLQLIGSGDDLSSTEREHLRITARALQSRGLVSVSKRTGQWRAALTADGRYYLENGRHPNAHRTAGQSGRTAKKVPDTTSSEKPVTTHDTAETSTRALRDRRAESVTSVEPLPSERKVHKRADGLEPVPVPERLQRPHPAVARLRDDVDRLIMPKDLRRRALLIFQAIASATLDRGWKVGDQPVDTRHRYVYGGQQKYRRREGALQVGIDGFTYAVTIDQEFPQSQDPVKSQRLKLYLPYTSYGQHKWADRKTMTLEDRLPEVIDGLARSAVGERKSAIAAEQAKVERQRKWEAAMASAKARALEHHFASTLDQCSKALVRFERLTAYCNSLEQRLQEAGPDHPDAETARQWLGWALAYTESVDPFQTLPTMPDTPEFKAEDLKPFLGRWSPYGPESSYGWR